MAALVRRRRWSSAAATAAKLQPVRDVSLALPAPPRVTQLTNAPTLFVADPDPHARIADACVLAADPSGLAD